jgi:hypothetical protein
MNSFLDLPAELRLRIYGLIATPTNAPFSAYHGLYLSCRQIAAELDHEAPKILKSFVSDLESCIPGAQLTISTTFLAPLHLNVTLDPDMYPTRDSVTSSHPLVSSIRLHVNSITIGWPEGCQFSLRGQVGGALWLFKIVPYVAAEIKARRVVVHTSQMHSNLAAQCNTLLLYQTTGWTSALSVEAVGGELYRAKVVWDRCELKCRKRKRAK